MGKNLPTLGHEAFAKVVKERDRFLHLLRVIEEMVQSTGCGPQKKLRYVLDTAREGTGRLCDFCAGPHHVSDAVAEENPFCIACHTDRIRARRTKAKP